MSTSSKLGTALITGASTGIGAVYADRLARRGYDLILVARRKPDLEKLAGRLHAEAGVRIQVLAADLTDEADLVRVEQVLHDDPSISLLVNNAGAATLGAFAKADIGRLTREIQLNIVAPTRLAHAALPGLLARNRGGLINIASVMSQMVQPGNAVYGATKAYLLHFSEVLALELGASAVRVQAVLPGATRTALWDGSGVELKDLPPEIVMDVDEMVDAALAGFDQGERITVPSLPDPVDWQRLIQARDNLQPNLSRKHSAQRYKIGLAAAV
ncbi:MAG TPA: SDR family oxidoreductase [Steroidobacteraceae bacterium]|jgi:short-subunit dehydrogenase|nr:SDR family oxidoreductase [Steroidobacteraceae bacterium]